MLTLHQKTKIKELFQQYGQFDYIGEHVTQSEHMLQSSYYAFKQYPNDKEFILGCLLHDIGHLIGMQNKKKYKQMDEWGTKNHEQVGSIWLKELGFSDRICFFVANHVTGKRYLVSKDKNYLNNLSEASRATLEYQGGLLSSRECEELEKNPEFQKIIDMRFIDDKSKKENIVFVSNVEQLQENTHMLDLDFYLNI
jgi:predicted HD phosphohydrolase